MIIREIEHSPLNLPMIPDVAPHMRRATTHGSAQSLCRVELASGAVGYGDGGSGDCSWIGRSALEALRHCRDGGVQMACYDAVGKELGVPAHVLMGTQVRPRVPFAYWTIDLPPDVLARQVHHAASLGYQKYKFKCRPWWDPIEQMQAASEAAPPGFQLWLDFNGHLREARLALPILKELSQFPCVGGFESPLPHRDVEGYRRLRRKIDLPIAVHYGGSACHVVSDPAFDPGLTGEVLLRERLADGYVLGDTDVDRLRTQAGALHEFHTPFWIQVVGTALRAAWLAHLTSTCSEALLSSLAAHDLWERDIAPAPKVIDGWLPVPTGPGLGIEVDEAAIDSLRGEPEPRSRKISTVVYPSGVRWSFADEQQRHEAFYFGHLPGFVPGVRLDFREDDGTAEFADLHARGAGSPVAE
jgi:L-alanine-DL-glutamate epimerase-like enolase superfamily enzyme